MIYSRSNTARALDTIYGAIVKITELWKVCCVVIKGQRATFVSKSLLKAAFVAFRKAGSRHVVIVRASATTFRAVGRDTCYTVALTATGVTCECQDYKNQVEQFKHGGVCKHGYAAL